MNANDIAISPDTSDGLTYLQDYREPDYLIDKTELYFDFQEDITVVRSTLQMRRNPNLGVTSPALILDGVNLDLRFLAIDYKALNESQYILDETSLRLENVPAHFTLQCVTEIKPKENTALVGLYQSKGLYCTQCEPQSFRHITYYLDRPDVLSEFIVTLEADKYLYPILLANGNLIGEEDLENNPRRHRATWHDPFKKPCYLFALVAGRLECIEDIFITRSGRVVTIRIFAESPQDLDKCHHAMSITKQAMRWDEENYGREYDLAVFMIAVVADFNYGGMENKGLNVYRADQLLIDPQTTTDTDFQAVTETVAHEYFHNWSGNRVTCRDWFQLSLKEGFTTYRGLQFNQDSYSAVVKRIEEAQAIRTTQFAEDASPLLHPIRPDAYRAIWNFYTKTVYQKGAEVVRMLATLLGPERYRKGTDLFFQRHDGQAVTTEEFIAAMESASNRSLSQFRLWYSQAGTPLVNIEGSYDAEKKQFTMTVKQNYLEAQDSQLKLPMHIPMVVSLAGQNDNLPFILNPANESPSQTIPKENKTQDTATLEITKAEQIFVFNQVREKPVPLLFQNFSAPVKWTYEYSFEDLLHILRIGGNDYSRWEASQMLWSQLIDQAMDDQGMGKTIDIPEDIIAFFSEILEQTQNDTEIDQGLVAKMLTLPCEAYLTEMAQPTDSIDVDGIHKACSTVKKQLAIALKKILQEVYGRYEAEEPVSITLSAMSSRALSNVALDYLVDTDDSLWVEKCYHQFISANNMTDTIAALSSLVNSDADSAKNLKQQALDVFYEKWRHQPLVVNQWFEVQACCHLPGTLARVKKLLDHPAFDIKSPNQVMALIGSFCTRNPSNFHHKDGGGYQFLVDQIIALNGINPQRASRTLAWSPLINWKRYDIKRQGLMKPQLQRLQRLSSLSSEVSEVVDKCL